MKNKVIVFVAILFVLTQIISQAIAQTPGGIDTDALKNDSVVRGVEDLQQIVVDRKWEEFGARWQEIFLKNSVISGINAFLIKINVVVRVLIGKNYSLSLELFFAFVLWLVTLIALPRYLSFLREKWMRWAVSLAIVIALANAQLFNLMAAGVFKVIFYKYSTLWKVLAYLIVFVALVAYYVILRIFGEKIKKSQEKKEVKESKKKEKKIDALIEGVTESGITDEYGD